MRKWSTQQEEMHNNSYTQPYSAHSNGVAESMNCTI